jgi:prepilin-type N-terminal cleavage/methylation domain-containing protein
VRAAGAARSPGRPAVFALMAERGFSLVEAVVAVAIILTLAAVALPVFQPWFAESRILGAGYAFKSQFRLAHSMAVMRGVYTAIRFEPRGEEVWIAVYADGNDNGVRATDIERGIDRRVSQPAPLTGGAPGVRVGINPGVPALPPDHGDLEGNPIRFGRSGMLSFSPLGTATPGTFYLAGEHAQAAVRVTGGSARVRLMVFRGGRWVER